LLELHAKAERFQSIGDAAVTRVNFRLKESRELTAINGSPAPARQHGGEDAKAMIAAVESEQEPHQPRYERGEI
jgi:hypothetical protein